MFLKGILLLLQAILPPAIVIYIGYITTLPWPEWRWLEYAFVTILLGFAFVIAVALIWKLVFWFHNQILDRYSNSSEVF